MLIYIKKNKNINKTLIMKILAFLIMMSITSCIIIALEIVLKNSIQPQCIDIDGLTKMK